MILTIILAFFSVIFLMIIHEFGHFIIAKKCGVKIEEFGIGYPPRIFGRKIGQTLYSLNLLPFGAFVKIKGETGGIEEYQSFIGLPMIKRVAIVLGGVLSFWIAAAILFMLVFNIGVELPITDEESHNLINPKIKIVEVYSGTPAQQTLIKKGDVIINIKNQKLNIKIDKVTEFQKFINENKGQEIILTIKRGDRVFDVSLTPRISPPENEGPIGVQLQRTETFIKKYPWYQTPLKGLSYCGELTFKAAAGLANLFLNLILGKGLPEGAEPAGPLGITVFLARAAELGAGFFLYFIGVVAVLVALTNLLPIPALDGGKLLFLAIEKIRTKAVSPKTENFVTMVFFIILIVFSIFITIKFDIPKFSEFLKTSVH